LREFGDVEVLAIGAGFGCVAQPIVYSQLGPAGRDPDSDGEFGDAIAVEEPNLEALLPLGWQPSQHWGQLGPKLGS
jgi:hypothetical protein